MARATHFIPLHFIHFSMSPRLPSSHIYTDHTLSAFSEKMLLNWKIKVVCLQLTALVGVHTKYKVLTRSVDGDSPL